MDTASGTGNSLEQLRAEALKIRQNVLEEVGLKAPKQELDALARSIQEQRKRKRSEPLDNSSSDVVRRSSRIASGPERKSMNEDALLAELAVVESAPARRTASHGSGGVAAGPPSLPAPPAPGSSKGYPCRIQWLNERFLGRFIPPRFSGMQGNQAKRAVMQAACGAPGGSRTQVSFNKYSGSPEWADGIILFANLSLSSGGDGGSGEGGAEEGGEGYKNAFSEGGRRFTWFASSKAHENSPVVLRLIHHASGARISLKDGSVVAPIATASTGSSPSASVAEEDVLVVQPCRVALVVRMVGGDPLPYVYCGELRYVRHEAGRYPLQFMWELVHAEEMLAEAATAGKGAVEDILRICKGGKVQPGFEVEPAETAAVRDLEAAYAPKKQCGVVRFGAVLAVNGLATA